MNCYSVKDRQTERELKQWVRACDEALEQKLDEAAETLTKSKDLHLIGLTGPTCSGKTTGARKLIQCFSDEGREVQMISVDDFYYDKDFLIDRANADPDIEIDYDSEETIDLALLREKTNELLSGKPTVMPHFDFQSGLREEGSAVVPKPNALFLFEGIQILYPGVQGILSKYPYQSLYISPLSAIEAGGEIFEPVEIRLMRRIVRDFRYRSASPDFTLYLWKSVRENEEKSIFPNLPLCNIKIDSTMPYEIGMLKPYLEHLLPNVPESAPSYGEARRLLKKLERVQPVSSRYITANSLYKEFI